MDPSQQQQTDNQATKEKFDIQVQSNTSLSTSQTAETTSNLILKRSPYSDTSLISLSYVNNPISSSDDHVIGPAVSNRQIRNSTLIRSQSTTYPLYPSSLSYATVRDFAYEHFHPMHYGTSIEEDENEQSSGEETPGEDYQRRFSDPKTKVAMTAPPKLKTHFTTEFDGKNLSTTDPTSGGIRLPAKSFGDGPPYFEDEDILSPIVTTATSATTSSKYHKKSRSSSRDYFSSSSTFDEKKLYLMDNNINDNEITTNSSRPGYMNSNGSSVGFSSFTKPTDDQYNEDDDYDWARRKEGEHSQQQNSEATTRRRRTRRKQAAARGEEPFVEEDEEEDTSISQLPEEDGDDEASSSNSAAAFYELDESRLSRDYQFTIASEDEEMHGKAVALFDFERENENELPLVEGQVIWVSYRHGQGWLVAQDPRSGESGLVPEEYVRLVRDIEGGLNGLNGRTFPGDSAASPISQHEYDGFSSGGVEIPAEHVRSDSGNSQTSGTSSNYYPPVQSQFSTSSKDLELYPRHQQLFGSQASTPTISSQELQFKKARVSLGIIGDDHEQHYDNEKTTQPSSDRGEDVNDDDDDDDDENGGVRTM